MAESKEFVLWFLANLPDFLMAEPINLFLGFAFLSVTIAIFKQIINVTR